MEKEKFNEIVAKCREIEKLISDIDELTLKEQATNSELCDSVSRLFAGYNALPDIITCLEEIVEE